MSRDDRSVSVPGHTPLVACPEIRIGIALALPLSHHLDGLVESAIGAGEFTNRKELLSAAILSLPSDPDLLADLVRRYRITSAAVVSGDLESVELVFPLPARGPRPRKRTPTK